MGCYNSGKRKGGCCKRHEYFSDLLLTKDMSEDDRYNAIINHYQRKHENCDPVLARIENASSIDDVVRIATAQDKSVGKHSHQNLININTLSKFCDELLLKKEEIVSVKSFNELHTVISKCRDELRNNMDIKGIGELCVYDIALRIGFYLKLSPDAIYLHRGTRIGARRLLGKIRGGMILKDMLPNAFQKKGLSCAELEDILCIYKDHFQYGRV